MVYFISLKYVCIIVRMALHKGLGPKNWDLVHHRSGPKLHIGLRKIIVHMFIGSKS